VSLPAFDPRPSARLALDVLGECGVDFALIGRVAMWTMLPEEVAGFTKDVDFAVGRRAIEPLTAALTARVFRVLVLSIGGLVSTKP